MQIETRDINKSCSVHLFSWWPLLQRSTSKKQLTALGLWRLVGRRIRRESSSAQTSRRSKAEAGAETKGEGAQEEPPPGAGRLAPCVGRTAFRRPTTVSVFMRVRTHANGYRIRGQIRIPYFFWHWKQKQKPSTSLRAWLKLHFNKNRKKNSFIKK
jgi:hypothetical protein